MSYGGELLVHAETLSTASQNVASAKEELNHKLHDLRTLLQPMIQSWTGQAALDYQARQQQWDQAQTDLADVLGPDRPGAGDRPAAVRRRRARQHRHLGLNRRPGLTARGPAWRRAPRGRGDSFPASPLAAGVLARAPDPLRAALPAPRPAQRPAPRPAQRPTPCRTACTAPNPAAHP